MLEYLNRLADVFSRHKIRYLFNCRNLVAALRELGFEVDRDLEDAILTGKDFIQIRGGLFPLDIVFAPDGIDSFDHADRRKVVVEKKFPCAGLEDILASKKAAGRQRDTLELPLLEAFKTEWDKRQRG